MPKSQNVLTSSSSDGILKENRAKSITNITDNAINKVPRVDIDGFTDDQNIYVQNPHKDLLKYARVNNDNKEVAFVFRNDLKDKTVFVGSDDVIDFGNGLNGKGNNLFIMHNHPRNSSYSDTDIVTFIRNENIKYLSIIKNNGEIEIISKSSSFNKERIIIEFKRQSRNM